MLFGKKNKKKKETQNKKPEEEIREELQEEEQEDILGDEEETLVEEKVIRAKDIADFWNKDIVGYDLEDIIIEVYKYFPGRGMRKIDFPYDDDRVTTSGGIRPPIYYEELKVYGSGKYTVRLRDINSGKIIAVQTVKIYEDEYEPAEEKEVKKTGGEISMFDLYKMQMEQNQQMMQTLINVLLEKKAQQPQPQVPQLDMKVLSDMFQKGVEIASNIKSKELEAKLEEIRLNKEIKLKEMDYQHEIRKLQLTEGVTVGDVADKLEEEGRVEEKNNFLQFIEGIVSAFDKLQTFLSTLGIVGQKPSPQPQVGVSQPFRPQSSRPHQPPAYPEEDFLGEEEDWIEEPTEVRPTAPPRRPPRKPHRTTDEEIKRQLDEQMKMRGVAEIKEKKEEEPKEEGMQRLGEKIEEMEVVGNEEEIGETEEEMEEEIEPEEETEKGEGNVEGDKV